ncbi:hypothetical protein SLE2022_279970 [Rubroshorea leprosula]
MRPQTPDISSPDSDDIQDAAFANRRCCYCIPCPDGVGSVWWQRIGNVNPSDSGNEEPWWMRGWKKVREWSELVAGPKWKTFIRRFKRCKHGGGMKLGKFHYDPLSYSLNFDEGPGQNGYFDEDDYRRNFSTRYATLPSSAKSSMDLGRGTPLFT